MATCALEPQFSRELRAPRASPGPLFSWHRLDSRPNLVVLFPNLFYFAPEHQTLAELDYIFEWNSKQWVLRPGCFFYTSGYNRCPTAPAGHIPGHSPALSSRTVVLVTVYFRKIVVKMLEPLACVSVNTRRGYPGLYLQIIQLCVSVNTRRGNMQAESLAEVVLVLGEGVVGLYAYHPEHRFAAPFDGVVQHFSSGRVRLSYTANSGLSVRTSTASAVFTVPAATASGVLAA